MSSAQSLSDITDERVVPVDYLRVLILLFLFMVLDRLFYTLGLHLGKVCPALPCPACPALPWLSHLSSPCPDQLRQTLLQAALPCCVLHSHVTRCIPS